MNLLDIKKYPQKVLRQKCETIDRVSENYKKFFRQMLITMSYFKGIGLAASQVGVSQRLIVVNINNNPIKLANPEIIKISGQDVKEEGCLSIPEAAVNIERPYKVIVKGINDKDKTVEIKAKGLLARVLQHEIDHLSGKLIIDYMSFFPRMRFKLKRRLR